MIWKKVILTKEVDRRYTNKNLDCHVWISIDIYRSNLLQSASLLRKGSIDNYLYGINAALQTFRCRNNSPDTSASEICVKLTKASRQLKGGKRLYEVSAERRHH